MPSEGWPSGIVTFLFSDIVGSTRQWEASPEMRARVDEHFRVSADAVTTNGGAIFSRMGDGIAAAFASAGAAAAAAVALQQAMPATGLAVRVGLHTGEVERRDDDYRGRPVNRAARIMAVAHGGQVVLSAATAAMLVDAWPLHDLGTHRLRDLSMPEHLWQLADPSIDAEFPRLRSVEAFATNLPAQRGRLIGRGTELRAVIAAVPARPVVTLVGVGGVGKTRLALQAAAELLDTFDAVHVAELAALDDGSSLAGHVAGALGMTIRGGPTESLAEALSGHRALLVLDNCEHVVNEAAALVDALVGRCPDLRVLATSREALDVDGEQVIAVSSLDAASSSELFSERLVDSGGSMTGAAGAIDELCGRLDHLPLALELAAARARSLGVEAVLAGLDDRFALLAGGRRRRAERHATMRATIDWSYRLLSDEEQRLFRWLGPHAGFELDTAMFVADGSGVGERRAAAMLASLVDRQMVVADTSVAPARYRMLETLRAYALEALADAGETTSAVRTHSSWMERLTTCSLADEDQAGLPSRFLRIEREPDNWRIAFESAIEHRDVRALERLSRPVTWGVLIASRPDLASAAERVLHLDLSTTARAVGLALLVARDGGTERTGEIQGWSAELQSYEAGADSELRFMQIMASMSVDSTSGRLAEATDTLLEGAHDPRLSHGHRAFLLTYGATLAFGLRLRPPDDPITGELDRLARTDPCGLLQCLANLAVAWSKVEVDESGAVRFVQRALELSSSCPEIIRRVAVGGSASRLLVRTDARRAAATLPGVVGPSPPRTDADWAAVLYAGSVLVRLAHPLGGPVIASCLRAGLGPLLNLLPDRDTILGAMAGHGPLPPAELHERLMAALHELADSGPLGGVLPPGPG